MSHTELACTFPDAASTTGLLVPEPVQRASHRKRGRGDDLEGSVNALAQSMSQGMVFHGLPNSKRGRWSVLVGNKPQVKRSREKGIPELDGAESTVPREKRARLGNSVASADPRAEEELPFDDTDQSLESGECEELADHPNLHSLLPAFCMEEGLSPPSKNGRCVMWKRLLAGPLREVVHGLHQFVRQHKVLLSAQEKSVTSYRYEDFISDPDLLYSLFQAAHDLSLVFLSQQVFHVEVVGHVSLSDRTRFARDLFKSRSVFKVCVERWALACVPPEVLSLPLLETLVLKHTHLRSISPLVGCPKISVLDVSHNSLCSVPQGLERAMVLQHLCLSHNKISSLPLAWPPELTHLWLKRNSISDIPTDIVWPPELQVLDLEGNVLRRFPQGLERLHKLKKVVVRGNPFTDLEMTSKIQALRDRGVDVVCDAPLDVS
jgi:hypothetical protein